MKILKLFRVVGRTGIRSVLLISMAALRLTSRGGETLKSWLTFQIINISVCVCVLCSSIV